MLIFILLKVVSGVSVDDANSQAFSNAVVDVVSLVTGIVSTSIVIDNITVSSGERRLLQSGDILVTFTITLPIGGDITVISNNLLMAVLSGWLTEEFQYYGFSSASVTMIPAYIDLSPTTSPSLSPVAATGSAHLTPDPTASTTATPTSDPTATPTVDPTATPTAADPTATPTADLIATPTLSPAIQRTQLPGNDSSTVPLDLGPTTSPNHSPIHGPTTDPTSSAVSLSKSSSDITTPRSEAIIVIGSVLASVGVIIMILFLLACMIRVRAKKSAQEAGNFTVEDDDVQNVLRETLIDDETDLVSRMGRSKEYDYRVKPTLY